jgi:ribosomal-protein-alanine N-acetyltransferase
MARVSHRDTRFHADPRFPIAQAEALYAEWIVRACERPECTVVVYDTGDGPLGYLASVRRDADVEVELLAVQPARRGQGIGSALLDSAVAASRHHGARRIVLATDAVNRVALQMYESKGFRPARTDLSYHKWYS